MSWISILKDKKYYIEFDSGYIFDDNNSVVAEITSGIQIKILRFFANNPEVWLEKDEIIVKCWPDIANAETISDNNFYKTIHKVKKIHIKVEESIESVRGMGYKYHGLEIEERANEQKNKTKNEPSQVERSIDGTLSNKGEKNSVIKLASLLIHKGGQDRPEINAELELEIRSIIELLEEGLSDDFEEICEQAWEELTLMQKAMKIFRAYENLTNRSRNLSLSDPNTKL